MCFGSFHFQGQRVGQQCPIPSSDRQHKRAERIVRKKMSRHIVAGFSTAGSSVGPASWVGCIPEDTTSDYTCNCSFAVSAYESAVWRLKRMLRSGNKSLTKFELFHKGSGKFGISRLQPTLSTNLVLIVMRSHLKPKHCDFHERIIKCLFMLIPP